MKTYQIPFWLPHLLAGLFFAAAVLLNTPTALLGTNLLMAGLILAAGRLVNVSVPPGMTNLMAAVALWIGPGLPLALFFMLTVALAGLAGFSLRIPGRGPMTIPVLPFAGPAFLACLPASPLWPYARDALAAFGG